jgi:hypothetical protein
MVAITTLMIQLKEEDFSVYKFQSLQLTSAKHVGELYGIHIKINKKKTTASVAPVK